MFHVNLATRLLVGRALFLRRDQTTLTQRAGIFPLRTMTRYANVLRPMGPSMVH